MRTKFFILAIVLAGIFSSCKNEKSVDSLEVVQPEVVDNAFKVTLNVTVKKDDTFSLYYTEDGSTDFTKSPPLWMVVKGNASQQDVVFSLPQDVIPTQLRLDFGMNKDQEPIVINSFQMNYFKNEFKIPGNQFFIYFDPDITKTIFDKTTATVSAVIKDGVRQSPSFYPNANPLGNEIKKIVR